MAWQELLTGACLVLALAAILYVLHYIYYFDDYNRQSKSAGQRTSRNTVATSSTQTSASHDARTAPLAGTPTSSTGESRAAGTRHADPRTIDTRHDRGSPWFGWVAGIGTLLAAGGILAYSKGDSIKQIVTASIEGHVQGEAPPKVVVDVVAQQEAPAAPAQEEAPAQQETVAEVETPASQAVEAPAADTSAAEAPAPQAADAPAAEAPAPVAAAAPEAPVASAVPGRTDFFGAGDGSRIMAWSGDAAMNPDYAAAQSPAVAEPAEPEASAGDAEGNAVAETTPEVTTPEATAPAAAPTATGVTSYNGTSETPDAEQAWAGEAEMNADYEETIAAAETAVENAPVAEATPEAAPVSLGGQGVTSYFGDGQTPDAGKPWSAEAAMNADYEAAAPAAPVVAQAPAAPEATPDAAPVSLGGQGVTSYFGDGQTPDAGKPWSAAATMNPDYKAAAAAAPAPAAEPAPVAASPPAPAAEAAPVSLGGQGVTSNFADGQTPDTGKPWSAPATVYATTAEPAAAKVADGCSDALNAALKAGKLNFVTSSWEITTDSFKTLDNIAKLAKDCSGVVIEVAGHTDNTGRAPSNQTLSENRAKAVVGYLTRAGVDAGKLKAVGYGQDKPVADNGSASGRRQNRRIEFAVTSK